jgi:hypothetical protein
MLIDIESITLELMVAVDLLDQAHQLVILAVKPVANEEITIQPVPLDFTTQQLFITDIASVNKRILKLLNLTVEFP